MIHPNIIGRLYGEGIANEFFWTGTRDYTPFISVIDALKFRN